MDPKELNGLMEAYSEVYAPKENIEEGIRSAVKRLLGGSKKETEAPKPENRGDQLRTKYNVGPEKSDTSAKRKILDRAKGNAERAQKQVDMGNASQSYADKAKGAHGNYLKAGYSKYGADAPYQGRGSKARKRAAALNTEDFEFIVNALIEEGYDLSSYTYDEMYDICLDEAVKGESSERRSDLAAERKAGHRPLSLSKGRDNANKMQRDINYFDKLTKKNNNEEVEIFDTVLEFLQVEGYAETLEEAEWLMANVIDEEAIDIILDEASVTDDRVRRNQKAFGSNYTPPRDWDQSANRGKGAVLNAKQKEKQRRKGLRQEEYMDEAQEARNNPEKYEAGQQKKSAPVRGEKTPMPPRGDKRREDFEKWYAANGPK